MGRRRSPRPLSCSVGVAPLEVVAGHELLHSCRGYQRRRQKLVAPCFNARIFRSSCRRWSESAARPTRPYPTAWAIVPPVSSQHLHERLDPREQLCRELSAPISSPHGEQGSPGSSVPPGPRGGRTAPARRTSRHTPGLRWRMSPRSSQQVLDSIPDGSPGEGVRRPGQKGPSQISQGSESDCSHR